jgi:protocatechuate 3,4-dioxygenase beta subunit
MKRAASLAGYLSLALLALFLVACGGSETAVESDDSQTPAASVDAEGSSDVASVPAASVTDCEPTQPDMLGPYYVAGAPVRTSVDTDYVTSGNMLSADGCELIPSAQIEFWLADSQGVYDDAHRATMLTREQGEYRFESNVPGLYQGRPPHIHVRVTASEYQELVTQHYSEAGQTEATFDLVLEPA